LTTPINIHFSKHAYFNLNNSFKIYEKAEMILYPLIHNNIFVLILL